MGILVCYDEFTYDVVSDLSVECIEEQVIGYDNSCEWEKVVIEDRPLPRREIVYL